MDLDRELGLALNVAPSPEFLARVRMRVADETMPSPWRFRWLVLAGAAAAVVVIAAVLTFWPTAEQAVPQQSAVPGSDPVGPAERGAVAAPPDVTPVAVPAGRTPRPAPRGAQVARVVTTPTGVPVDREPERELPPFPEVLISADEVRAYQLLLGIAEQQRIPPPPQPSPADDGGVELHDIRLASLQIEALPPLARLEGERP